MALGGRGGQVIGVAYLFLVLSTVSVFLRCYVRLYLVKRFKIDDYFCLLSWALFMVNLGFVVTAAYHGTGQHAVDMPAEEFVVGLKWWWFCEPSFVLASMAIKFSIGIYLVHIAQIRTHRIILWLVIAIMEAFSFFFFFLFILQCRPSTYFWTQHTGGEGSCIEPNFLVAVTYAYSAIACLTDWIYAIMPAFILWNLKIDLRTKISVGVLMALGASASITTVIRIPYLQSFRNTADFLYATTDVALWTTAELGIGISAASLATLRPLLRQMMGESPLAISESTTTMSGSYGRRGLKGAGYVRSEDIDGVVVEDYRLKSFANAKIDVERVVTCEDSGERDRGWKGDVGIQPIANVQYPDRERERERVIRIGYAVSDEWQGFHSPGERARPALGFI